MTDESARELLLSCNWGVLSAAAPEGTPYGVPLNYAFLPEENALCLHCAREGKKLDILKENPKACFTVVGKDGLDQKELTTYYESVIVQGKARILDEPEEKARYILKFCKVLAPLEAERQEEAILKHVPALSMVLIDIEEITGKANPGKET